MFLRLFDVRRLGTAISASSFAAAAAQRGERGKGRGGTFLLARAALRVQIRPAARAQPATLLAAQRLDRWGERDQLARKAAEVDLRPLVPPHLELVAEAHPEARQVARRLRFGPHPPARPPPHQPTPLPP